MPWSNEHFPKRLPVPIKNPTILSPKEVNAFFNAIPGIKNRAVVMTCYGAGLRISEAVARKIADIDSARMVLRIDDGKGGDGRFALLSPRLLAVLRTYFPRAPPHRRFSLSFLARRYSHLGRKHPAGLSRCHASVRHRQTRQSACVPA